MRRKQRSDRVFFTDRDLGRQFPEALRSAGLTVERHSDHFADDALDEEWIAEVAARGWVAVTHDKAISRRPNERAAVFAAGLALIVVVGGAPQSELAANFVSTLPAIHRFLDRHDRPFVERQIDHTIVDRHRPIVVPRVAHFFELLDHRRHVAEHDATDLQRPQPAFATHATASRR